MIVYYLCGHLLAGAGCCSFSLLDSRAVVHTVVIHFHYASARKLLKFSIMFWVSKDSNKT